MLKKLLISIILIISSANSSNAAGTIHLFADPNTLDISADIYEYGFLNVWIAYAPTDEEGPGCITGMEFMIHWEPDYLVALNPPVLNEYLVGPTMGEIRTGISIGFLREVYIHDKYFFLGYFTLMGMQDIVSGSNPVILTVLAHPTNERGAPIVCDCDCLHTIKEVNGSQFVLPYEASVIATETKSWGAIKSMY